MQQRKGGGPVRTRTGTAGLGNQSSILLSYGAVLLQFIKRGKACGAGSADLEIWSSEIRKSLRQSKRHVQSPRLRPQVFSSAGGDHHILASARFVSDGSGVS